jgi:hypothetical protein
VPASLMVQTFPDRPLFDGVTSVPLSCRYDHGDAAQTDSRGEPRIISGPRDNHSYP